MAFAAAALLTAALAAAPQLAAADSPRSTTPATTTSGSARAVVPLYFCFAALQGLDIESTARALDAGGREANPIVAGAWQSMPAVIALKASVTAGLMFATERLRKQNPKAALILMIAANSAMATIVAHNYAIAR